MGSPFSRLRAACQATAGAGRRRAPGRRPPDRDSIADGPWDATIVRIVDDPIRQAFFAAYKKFLRLIEEQVRKFAEAKERENEPRLKAAAAAGIVPQASGPVDVCKMVGIVAALGVGIGAVGTLTDVKTLPRGATRSLDDPFEDREARRRRRLF